MTPTPWRSRITGHADVPPATLIPNPRNWRTHPADQQRALGGALSEIGWVAEVLVNKTTGNVVDGHLRIELALAREEPSVPVSYVELTEAEERLVLATLDPLAAMAEAEATSLASLLAGLEPADNALRALLDDLAKENGLDTLRAGLADPDDVPDLPEAADVHVKRGEFYVLGDHRLLCGDSTRAEDVGRVVEGQEAAIVWTDPRSIQSASRSASLNSSRRQRSRHSTTWATGGQRSLGPSAGSHRRWGRNLTRHDKSFVTTALVSHVFEWRSDEVWA